MIWVSTINGPDIKGKVCLCAYTLYVFVCMHGSASFCDGWAGGGLVGLTPRSGVWRHCLVGLWQTGFLISRLFTCRALQCLSGVRPWVTPGTIASQPPALCLLEPLDDVLLLFMNLNTTFSLCYCTGLSAAQLSSWHHCPIIKCDVWGLNADTWTRMWEKTENISTGTPTQSALWYQEHFRAVTQRRQGLSVHTNASMPPSLVCSHHTHLV